MTPRVYSLYGLTLRSALTLPAAPAAAGAAVDWDIHLEEARRIPSRPPRGRVLVEHWFNRKIGYAHSQVKGNISLRYFRACEFHCQAAGRISVRPDPRVPEENSAILLAGSVPACLLALAGETVLHASAVTVNGVAIAFAGHSGSGKSTVAAMACAQGAGLLTDDVLRLDPTTEKLRCYRGARELRLRPNAAELAAVAARRPPRNTADGRVAIEPAAAAENRPPLAAVVIPCPRRDQVRHTQRRLPAGEALAALLSYPRVLGWRDHRLGAGELPVLARLVREVPVFEATIPWGPPFDLSHVAALVREVTEHFPQPAAV